MNYLTKGLAKTIQSIKEHKLLFIFLIVLEIILLILSAYIIIFYQVQILTNLKNIIEPIENANYNETTLQQGQPFTQDLFKIYSNYNLLIKNILYLFSALFLIFFFLNSLIWVCTHLLLEPKKQPTERRRAQIPLSQRSVQAFHQPPPTLDFLPHLQEPQRKPDGCLGTAYHRLSDFLFQERHPINSRPARTMDKDSIRLRRFIVKLF